LNSVAPVPILTVSVDKMRTDLHITNNSNPEDWLPVIEAIKATWYEPFQTSFALLDHEGKPTIHIASNFIVELLEDYVERHKK